MMVPAALRVGRAPVVRDQDRGGGGDRAAARRQHDQPGLVVDHVVAALDVGGAGGRRGHHELGDVLMADADDLRAGRGGKRMRLRADRGRARTVAERDRVVIDREALHPDLGLRDRSVVDRVKKNAARANHRDRARRARRQIGSGNHRRRRVDRVLPRHPEVGSLGAADNPQSRGRSGGHRVAVGVERHHRAQVNRGAGLDRVNLRAPEVGHLGRVA